MISPPNPPPQLNGNKNQISTVNANFFAFAVKKSIKCTPFNHLRKWHDLCRERERERESILARCKKLFCRLRGDAHFLEIRGELRRQSFLQILPSHPDYIFEIPNIWHAAIDENAPPIRFYLPDAMHDFIQNRIALSNSFFDVDVIESANPFFPDGANILDIGTNIGNNALYYACVRRAKKVIAFEPMADVFAILQKNVQLNNLENVVFPQKFALGEKSGNASVPRRSLENLGGAGIWEDSKGLLKIKSLDELEAQNFFPDKINFVKIDVEGFEAHVLKGAREFLKRHKPTIQMECFSAKSAEMVALVRSLGYKKECAVGFADYIYLPE